jgi:hypothetical protein
MRFEITGTKLGVDGSTTEILRWTPIVWGR